jgi:hypothetical protein
MAAEWHVRRSNEHDGEPMFTFSAAIPFDQIRKQSRAEHPFHLHGQFFTIRDAKLPGLKDVVLVPGMGTVEVDAYFDNRAAGWRTATTSSTPSSG